MRRLLPLFILCSIYLVGGSFANATTYPGHAEKSRFGMLILTAEGKHPQHRYKQGHGHRGFAVMLYERAAPTFNYQLTAVGLQPHQAYTLVYFPEPAPGDNLYCLGQASSNHLGKLRLHRRIDLNSSLPTAYDANYPTGASLRLVLSRDVDCGARHFIAWQPAAYLFGVHLIRYIDTDTTTGYSGRYCMSVERTGGNMLLIMDLQQSGSDITAILNGLNFTGTVSSGVMTLSGTGPDGTYDIELTFSQDGSAFSGSVSTSSETMAASGSKGTCSGYVDPPGDPACSLPVADPSLVVGGQQFNSVTDGIVHTGLDFKFDLTLPTIVAPCDGMVSYINLHPIAHDNLIIDVGIRYNTEWEYFIAFEPYSPDPVIATQQQAEIAVTLGQIVHRGDVLGRLVVPPGSEYPHLHWGVNRTGVGPVCPRDVLSVTEQTQLDNLYAGFGLSPACLPAP